MHLFNQFFEEGFFHIVAWDALDHILFVLSFIAIYDLKEWKKVLWIVTSFTIAHSVTLLLSFMELIIIKSSVIEVLIAGTISFTCVENLFFKSASKHRVIVTGFFGLIHGLGFSGALKSLFMGMDVNLFETLLPFNLGIEAGQLVLIGLIFILFYLVYRTTKVEKETINKLISIPSLLISVYWIFSRVGIL